MKLNYNISNTYCSDWTEIEALREIVQNAIDSNRPYTCEFNDKIIKVTTEGATLEPRVFTIGVSEKADGAIGKYGEGFKIAMLVLTRLELNPVIFFGKYAATGSFELNDFTGVKEFCINIEEVSDYSDDIVFICDVNHVDTDLLCERVTHFTEHPLPVIRNNVEVLYTKPGQIYVSGLWVCEDNNLSYGYNFSPDSIELNRDRNMVNGIHWTLGKYYAKQTDKAELVFKLLENDANDIANLQYHIHSNKELKAELARLFYNKYGDGAKIGKPTVQYIGSSHTTFGYNSYSTFSKCGIEEQEQRIKPNSPLGILTKFLEDNKKHMRRDLRNKFITLINQSKGW